MRYYRKRYYPRRRQARRSRYGIYKSAGSQLWKDVKWLKSLVNIEKKYSDMNASITPSTTPTLVLLNGLSQGDTGTSREGQSIKMSSVQCRLTVQINVLTTTTNIRMIVFRDRQANASAPTAANILQNSTGINSPLNMDYSGRFKVYYDKQWIMSLNGGEGIKYDFYKKLRFHTKYNTGNAGTIADITTNSLYCLFMSDQATNTPTLAYYFRIRWIDN